MAPTGKNRFAPLDASAFLRNDAAAPLTASADGTYFDLGRATNEWHTGDVAAKLQFAVAGIVTAIDTTTGDETYTVAIKVSNADGTVTKLFSAQTVGLGAFALPITKEMIQSVAGASRLTITATLAGTSPSLDFIAWVAPFYG